MNKPKIRIKGFKEEWKTKSIEEIANRYDNLRVPVKESDRIKGKIPYYGANGIQDYVDGYTHDGEFILIAEDGANDLIQYPVQYVNGKVWVNNHAHVLQSKENYANNMFLKYSVSCADIKSILVGGSRSKLNSNTLMKLTLFVPSITEQHSIANFFRSLDSLIQSADKKLASLKQIKAASLQSMFPQNNETKPKVRFKGFEEEWISSKLGELFAERSENNIYGEMLSVTMNQGIIKASENGRFDNSNSDKSKYKVVKINDIAYNSMRMWQGASGCSQYEGIVSPAYTVIVPNDDVNSLFFAYMFKTLEMIKTFRLNSQGLTSDTWNLKYPALSKIIAYYPSNLDEQQKIASYFRSLDNQISLQAKQLEKLKQIKTACLDKMFV